MPRSPLALLIALTCLSCEAWAQGNPLGPEFRVNTYTTGYQLFPAAAFDPSGNFVVIWSSNGQDGDSTGVFGQRYANSGAPLGPEFRVNTYTTNFQAGAAVAADSSGGFVVIWESYTQDGSDSGIFGQRYASSGAPLGPEFRINTYTTENQGVAKVASDASGGFVVVWMSGGDGDSDISGQRYASSGAPLGSEFRVNTYTTSFQRSPAVASDASGNFVVVWESYMQDGQGEGVFGQRFASSGSPLGPEFRVNTQTAFTQYGPSVASDASGNFVVVWSSDPAGFAFDVHGQRYASSGTPLGPEFRVNTYTPDTQDDPSIAADPFGGFVVVWQSAQDGSSYGIFGQRYAGSGAPLGSEFRANTYTSSLQVSPAVAADPAGNFVVVWRSMFQDGSGYGIFGQRYGPIVPVELMRFGVE